MQRERKTAINEEKSVIDYLIICEGMKEYLEEMFIDDDRIFVLTKYNKKGNMKTSDHNIMIGNFNLKFDRNNAPARNEIFNFKNRENQEAFFEETNSTKKLSDSFSSERSFTHNSTLFIIHGRSIAENKLKLYCQKSLQLKVLK